MTCDGEWRRVARTFGQARVFSCFALRRSSRVHWPIAGLRRMPSRRICKQGELVGYPRRQQVDPLVSGVYHCISRCVRGQDIIELPQRCAWVVDRLESLTKIFAIDVCDFAIMRNHVHLLLRTHPHVAFAWTDEEVARRWISRPGGAAPVDPQEAVRLAVRDPLRMAEWRSRLSDLGWFHKLWKEPCSRMWNRQESQAGHLWQGRYRSIGCRDETAVLMQAAYILLNPVHCGAEAELCDSPRTSMGRRMAALSEAIAAGRCGQGVRLYRQVLLEPVLPCDPGLEVRSLSDHEWSERLARRVHERALREMAADLGRRRPFRDLRVTSPIADGIRLLASDHCLAEPKGKGLDPESATSADGTIANMEHGINGLGDAAATFNGRLSGARRARESPRSQVPRRKNPWRERGALSMAASCTLANFMQWTDLKGRVRRADKAGWIDPAKPRLLDCLARRGRWAAVDPGDFTSGSIDAGRLKHWPSTEACRGEPKGMSRPPPD